jgi:hypothetical protein
MRQRLALVSEQENEIAGLGLGFAQLEPQTDAIDLVCDLATLQRVPQPPETESPFWRSTLESCEREIERFSRAAISLARRASVQFVLSATGCDRRGPATLSAACAFSGTGPGATLAFSASIPPCMKSLRQSRTVSSRTPKACAIRLLVQPSSVSRIARARSASALFTPPAHAFKTAFCSSVAVTGDLPAMSCPRESLRRQNHSQHLLARSDKPLKKHRVGVVLG